MAHIQAQFEQFNTTIRLGRFDENAILREKRDIIRDKLETRLPEVFAAHKETCPDFSFMDQGSYAMNTGIKPLDGDFDIDQGLYFEISIEHTPTRSYSKSACMKRSTGIPTTSVSDARASRSFTTATASRSTM